MSQTGRITAQSSQNYMIKFLKTRIPRELDVDLVKEKEFEPNEIKDDFGTTSLTSILEEFDSQNVITEYTIAKRATADQMSVLSESLRDSRNVICNRSSKTVLIAKKIRSSRTNL